MLNALTLILVQFEKNKRDFSELHGNWHPKSAG